MKKIKILYVMDTLSLGGAETYALNLARAIDPERFEVHVAYSYGGDYEEKYIKSGIRLYKYAREYHKIKSLASPAIILKLAHYVRENAVQIIHTFNFNAHIWSLCAAKLSGAKILEHVHDFRYLEPEEYKRRRGTATNWRYMNYLKKTSDHVVVLTEQNRRFLIRNNFCPEDRVSEIQNGISLAPLPSVDRAGMKGRFGLPTDSLIISTAGRIVPEKNIDLILKIAPSVVAKESRAKFIISGYGPLLETYRLECKMKGMDPYVIFPGFCPDPAEILGMADIVLHPSLLELHSLSIMEALRMKIPVIASKDVGCHNEIFAHWENAVLLDPFNPDEWAPAVLKLLEDAGLRRSIGQRGFDLCKSRFDMDQAAREIENVYARLAG